MAEVDHNTQAKGQSGSREPNRAHAAEKVDMHKHFMTKLGSEPETPIQGQELGSGSEQRQPENEEQQEEQTSGQPQDAAGDEANRTDDAGDGQESEESPFEYEYTRDDGTTYWGDENGVEFGAEDTEKESEEESGTTGEIGALQVDDASYTVEDVRQLVQRNRELDADYRRKTSVMSRLRQEYEVSGQEISAVGSFFGNIARQNLQQYEQMDTKDMTPEEFQVYRNQYDSAKRGTEQLGSVLENLRKEVRTKRGKHLDDSAAESVEVLKGIEPRWNNEFYSKVRDFAVKSGRYQAEEFSDVTDWRTMEGVISLMDAQEVVRIAKGEGDGKSEIKEPGKRKRRRQRQRQNRNAKGQYVTSRETVLSSPNAKKDGTLRNMFMAKLENERR